MDAGADIQFERRGAAGLITLNRPQALNAVTHAMVLALRAQLDVWADEPAITRVAISAAGERAFSAGGDIRALYDLGCAAGMRRRCNSGATNIRSTWRSRIFASPMWR